MFVVGIDLCVLCDSDPPLPVLQEAVEVCWSPVEHYLRSYSHTHSRCVPAALKFDASILALCLVRLDKSKSLTCLSPSSSAESRTALTAGRFDCHTPILLESNYSQIQIPINK